MHYITKTFAFGVIAISLLLIGLLLQIFIFPITVKRIVKKNLALDDGSEHLSSWLSPPPLNFKVYIFNVTNPDEVHIGAQPKVVEVGPYVYTEHHNKEVIQYHDDDTISYVTRKKFFFDEEKSKNLRETDIVTVMNPALMGIILMVQEVLPFALVYISEAIPYLFTNQTTIFSTVSVGELLFRGILINCTHDSGFGKLSCDAMKGRTPNTMRFKENSTDYLFSFFNHKNDTVVGPFRVYRGREDIKKLGLIKEYQHKEELTVWPKNSTCNIIRGTDSTIFTPFIKKTDSIYVFVPEMCGSMLAEYDSETHIDKILVRKYIGSRKNYADPIKYPPNRCHCSGIDSSQTMDEIDVSQMSCPKEGAMYLKLCHKAPVIFSRPHFYLADHEYVDFVSGLHPSNDKHETFLNIEPNTGTPIEGCKRLQMNMFLKNVTHIAILANVRTGVMPMLWVEEEFVLDDEHRAKLNSFYSFVNVLHVGPWLLIICGLLSFIMIVIYHSTRRLAICSNGSYCAKISAVQNHVAENNVNYNNETIKTISSQIPLHTELTDKTVTSSEEHRNRDV